MKEVYADTTELTDVLAFSGPDAVRFLNGQITQDVKLVMGNELVLPSCVTDAKGKLQFRIWLADGGEGTVLVFTRSGTAEALEARLTKYLIADDVEVVNLTGEILPEDFPFPAPMSEEERIKRGLPKWGAELTEGMLPPEANLDETDISYTKGCYIGQEVISRIKSAKKTNRKLVRMEFEEPVEPGEISNPEGKVCGELTSTAGKFGLGYLKRSAQDEEKLLRGGMKLSKREQTL